MSDEVPASARDVRADRRHREAEDRLFITRDPLDVGELIRWASVPSCGAVASFVGTVRSPNYGRIVERIDYQGYEAMLGPQLQSVADDLHAAFDVRRLVVAHRLGVLGPAEASIAIVAATPHRDDAFAACRRGLELCKERLPIWKYETGDGTSAWVEGTSTAGPTLE